MHIPKDIQRLIFPGHDRQKKNDRLTDTETTDTRPNGKEKTTRDERPNDDPPEIGRSSDPVDSNWTKFPFFSTAHERHPRRPT
jgi:hypothetical protein